MPEHHHEEQMISHPIPSILGRFKEGFGFSWIKEVLGPVRISCTFNIIRVGNVEHGRDFLRYLLDWQGQLSTKLR
jgi:hypothetical protein